MSHVETISKFIADNIHTRTSAALWFMPGENEVQFVSEKLNHQTHPKSLYEISEERGVVFYPFDDTSATPVILSFSGFQKGFDAMELFCESEIEAPLPEMPHHIQSTSKEDYLRSLHHLISRIQRNEAQKVVFSKIKIVPKTGKTPAAKIFLQLKAKHPSAFCWMFYSPESSLWIGASPELLISQNENKYQTMALAGSRKADGINSCAWPEKERQEQQYVTDFIINQLKNIGISTFEISQPYTSAAGKIEHIRTDILFETDRISIGEVLVALHPTPAVCGLPKNEALAIITQTEQHQREYYTGFLGTLNVENSAHLFVNLRCMKIWENHYQLFTGGGITWQSDPEAEWEETELKTNTMMEVIEE